jgi:cytoskeletal protein RodZ
MAEYKGIKGFKVQTVSTDPAASIPATGTWASGNSMNTGRLAARGAGIQTAAIVAGGSNAPTYYALTESYDGSSWTEVNDLNQVRSSHVGAGTQTAAIMAGGRISLQQVLPLQNCGMEQIGQKSMI